MITLNPKQRRELRARAHALHPVVAIGQQGLTPQVMQEVDLALRAHALIKVRVFSDDRAEREALLARIADELDAAPVQHIGKLLVLWRPPEEKPASEPPKRRARESSGPRGVAAKSSAQKRPAASDRATHSRRGRSRNGERTPPVGSDPVDARTRRRRASTTRDDTQASSAAPANRRPRAAPEESMRSPRGKSAPNPRRRRRAS